MNIIISIFYYQFTHVKEPPQSAESADFRCFFTFLAGKYKLENPGVLKKWNVDGVGCQLLYLAHMSPLRWAASIIPPSIWNSPKASSTWGGKALQEK